MASRAKKKNGTEAKEEAKKNLLLDKAIQEREKHSRQVPFVMLVGLLLILVCFCIPFTGISVKLSNSELSEMMGSSGSDSSEETTTTTNQYTEFGKSFSLVTIMFAPVNMSGLGGDDWLGFMTTQMIENASNKELMSSIVQNFINAKYSDNDKEMFAKVMNVQLFVAYVMAVFWIVLVVMACIVGTRGKGVLTLLVVSCVFALISVVEMLTLMIISLSGVAGSSFVTNVGAYFMTIVGVGMSLMLARNLMLIREQNKTIKELEK